ncbi:MAG: phosphotransferase [Bryobacteraceae bacterium]
MLTPASLLSYLRLRGINGTNALFQGQWGVSAYQGRNTLLFARAGSLHLTIKQAGSWRHDQRQALTREAEWYWLAHNDSRFLAFRCFLPRIYSWDPERSIFVMETIPGKSFPQLPQHQRFHPPHAAQLGQAMALVHSGCAEAIASPDLARHFPRDLPSFLNVPQAAQRNAQSKALSAGQKEFYSVLRVHPEFDPLLAQLRESWRTETLIHSDWKLANCLIDASAPTPTPHIIDWELVHHGDSIWDAATLLQSYWNYWVEHPSLHPLTEIRPALSAFWSAYCSARHWSTEESAANRTRAVAFAGARMLQTIFESTAKLDTIQPNHVRLMQASLNILQDPAAATKEFFPA